MALIQDNFSIDYINKRIYHDTSDPSSDDQVYSVNELYSYLQDTFDELDQMDDYTPMTAQTPTAYTLVNGWFIDDDSMKYLDGGAITQANNSKDLIKIYWMPTSDSGWTPFIPSDIGLVYTGGTSAHTGVLLSYDNTNYKIYLRSVDTGDIFDNAGESFTSSGTGVFANTAVGIVEDALWANVYTLGTLASAPEPQVYIFQDGESLTEWSDLDNWDRGHIDVLIKVKQAGVEIDSGNITVFARQFGDLYDNFVIDLTAGGRNAVPLATSTDGDNASPSYYLSLDGTPGDFTNDIGEILTSSADGTAEIVSYLSTGTNVILGIGSIKGTFADGNTVIDETGTVGTVNGTPGDGYLHHGTGGTLPDQTDVGKALVASGSGAERTIKAIDVTDDYIIYSVDDSKTGLDKTKQYIPILSTDSLNATDGIMTNCIEGADGVTAIAGYGDITITFVNGTVDYTAGGTFTLYERVTWDTGSGEAIVIKQDGASTGTLTLGNVQGTSLATPQTIDGDLSLASCSTTNATYTTVTTEDMFYTGVEGITFPMAIVIEGGSIYNAGRPVSEIYEYMKFVCREDSIHKMYVPTGTLDGEEYITVNSSYALKKASPFGTYAGGTIFGAQGVFIVGQSAADAQSLSLLDTNGDGRIPPIYQNITISSVSIGDVVSVFRSKAPGSFEVDKTQFSIGVQQSAANTTITVVEDITISNPVNAPSYPALDPNGWIRVVDTGAEVEYRIPYSSYSGKVFTVAYEDTIGDYTGGLDINTDDTAYVPLIDRMVDETTVLETVIYTSEESSFPLVIRARQAGKLPYEASSSFTSTGTSVGAIRSDDDIYTA